MNESRPERFSRRHGYQRAEPEITVRDDAPSSLRAKVNESLADFVGPATMREIVCSAVGVRPNRRYFGGVRRVDGSV